MTQLTIFVRPTIYGPAFKPLSNLGGSHHLDGIILILFQCLKCYFLLHCALLQYLHPLWKEDHVSSVNFGEVLM